MKVKICGITRLADARKAIELGAWALGFVFYPPSPRSITPEAAREIIQELPSSIKTIGVFVNATQSEIEEAVDISGIQLVQLHGEESPKFCQQLSQPVIKAFRLKSEQDLEQIQLYTNLDAILIDAAVTGAWGGTGQVANWELVKQIQSKTPLILAGGLKPENVQEAIQVIQPFAVDLSSGVESSPGIKDHQKLAALFEAIPLQGELIK